MPVMRDWNLYHKLIMTFIVSFAFVGVVRAVQAYMGGGLAMERELLVNYSAAQVWPMVSEDENRERWEAFITDISHLSGDSDEVGSTRFLFWRNLRSKRWVGLEETSEILPERVVRYRRQSDFFDRSFEIELEPQGACQTLITIRETVVPISYSARYWSFLEKDQYSGRLDLSVEALNRWLAKLPECSGN